MQTIFGLDYLIQLRQFQICLLVQVQVGSYSAGHKRPWHNQRLHEGTCQKLAGGKGGVETEGGSQLFETVEKGGVVKNGPLKGGWSCKYVSVIM